MLKKKMILVLLRIGYVKLQTSAPANIPSTRVRDTLACSSRIRILVSFVSISTWCSSEPKLPSRSLRFAFPAIASLHRNDEFSFRSRAVCPKRRRKYSWWAFNSNAMPHTRAVSTDTLRHNNMPTLTLDPFPMNYTFSRFAEDRGTCAGGCLEEVGRSCTANVAKHTRLDNDFANSCIERSLQNQTSRFEHYGLRRHNVEVLQLQNTPQNTALPQCSVASLSLCSSSRSPSSNLLTIHRSKVATLFIPG